MQRLQKQDPKSCCDRKLGNQKNNGYHLQEDAYNFYQWVDKTFPGQPGVSETKLGLQVRGCLVYVGIKVLPSHSKNDVGMICEFDAYNPFQ